MTTVGEEAPAAFINTAVNTNGIKQGLKNSAHPSSRPQSPCSCCALCLGHHCPALCASSHHAVFCLSLIALRRSSLTSLPKAITPFQVILLRIPFENFSPQALITISNGFFFFFPSFKIAGLHLCIVCVHSPRLECNHRQGRYH